MIRIYDNIKSAAKAKRVSIRSIERYTGLGSGSVCKWNNSSPSVVTLLKVADALGVHIDELLKES